MKSTLLILLICMFQGFNSLKGQKNLVYVTLGSSSSLSINYERLITERWDINFRSHLKLSASKLKFPLFGRGSDFKYTKNMYSISTCFLWGSDLGHFELNGGLALVEFDEPDPFKESTTVIPVLGVAGRLKFQKLFIRLGLGLPEGVQVGLGYIFK